MSTNADGYDRACDGWEADAELDAELVRRIWSALAAKRYDPGPVDGVMGGRTRPAIAASHARPPAPDRSPDPSGCPRC